MYPGAHARTTPEEDALILHPDIADVAVFGVPNAEFGEEVKAVVQLVPEVAPSDDLAQSLIAYAREHIAHYMVPRSIDFIDELPRLPPVSCTNANCVTPIGRLTRRILGSLVGTAICDW